MPYLTEKDQLGLIIEPPKMATKPGHLNFIFTVFSNWYIHTKGESYQTYNDIIGALEGAKLEVYRRKIAAYENKKIKTNGDVY